MINFFYNNVIFFKKRTKMLWKYIYKINKLIVNVLYPITHYFSRKNGLDENSEIIISLTSYPGRIKTVWLTIETLLNQKKMRPKKIILWLSSEQFIDVKIPKKLLMLEKRGLKIKYCDDLKPHKKYYYSFKEYNSNLIITVDDDMLYPSDFVEKLYNGYKKYPNAIICNWAHKIKIHDNLIDEYNSWEPYTNELSILTVPIGCCGVLYNPKMFNSEIYDKEKIKNLSLFTDDLWLKWMEVLNDIPAININESNLIFFNNIRNQFSGLWKQNAANENRNDINIRKLSIEYPDFIKKIKEQDL